MRKDSLLVANRLLTAGVIVLSLISGYLWSERQGWLKPSTPALPTPAITSPDRPQLTLTQLPPPDILEKPSLYKTLMANIQHHIFTDEPLTQAELSAVLWSAQGTISPWGDRTAPSYKALYPLKLTLLLRKVDGIKAGRYSYIPELNSLQASPASSAAVLHFPGEPPSLLSAPVVIGLSIKPADPPASNKAEWVSAARFEAGQITENIYLATNGIGLGAVSIFDIDSRWPVLMGLNAEEQVVAVIPVGKPKDTQAGTPNTTPTKPTPLPGI